MKLCICIQRSRGASGTDVRADGNNTQGADTCNRRPPLARRPRLRLLK